MTPYAVRLALDAVEAESADAIAQAGRTAGRLSALATGGSLLGTFLAALALIPLLGTRRTFLLFALSLAVVAAWGLLAARRAGEPGADPEASTGSRGRLLGAALLVPTAILVLLLLPYRRSRPRPVVSACSRSGRRASSTPACSRAQTARARWSSVRAMRSTRCGAAAR